MGMNTQRDWFLGSLALAWGIGGNTMSGNARSLGQLVAHLIALRVEIAGVVLVDRADDRHLIDDLKIEAAVNEGVGLLGIVRQQADP